MTTFNHDGPVSGWFGYWLGRLILGLFGWSVEGQLPPGKKFILIGAPHTSNWDFPFALAAAHVFRIKMSWMGKDALFRKPFGAFMRHLGGIPIRRDSREGVVDQIVRRFNETERLVIAIAPSGTRSQASHWKSGFYWIAHSAGVPIVCVYMDYDRKVVGLGLSFVPSGDVGADMDKIREFYRDIKGKKPEIATPIRLSDESGGDNDR